MKNIIITMGDPAGIGPELAVKTALHFQNQAHIVIAGSRSIIEEAARRFTPNFTPHVLETCDLPMQAVQIGTDSPHHGLAALESLNIATNWVIAKKADALLTAPMSKHAVNLAGIRFQGHTEFIAEKCNTTRFVMQQSTEDGLRVVFSTCHIPLSQIFSELSVEKICDVTRLLIEGIQQEGITHPKIAMSGLNPHAGEQGHMGQEEKTLLLPAIEQLKKEGVIIEGPYPPDILFLPHIRKQYDGIVTHYHDQGHIPFKLLAFDRGVNSTLGLPIIRTSPDHGTAYNIAWQGVADTGSMFAAFKLALKKSQC